MRIARISILVIGPLLVALATLHAAGPTSRKSQAAPQHPGSRVTLGGEVGAAAEASFKRLQSAPYDSVAWLRADLTGERLSESDDIYGHPKRRPYKEFSGDISGRFIEIMAMNSCGSYDVHPVLRELLAEVPRLQRPGGYFSAFETVDWQQPIDFDGTRKTRKTHAGANWSGNSTMMPALWGNARMLCGLVEAARAFHDPGVLETARRLGDFYVGLVPRFADPARMAEYAGGDSYAAGYVTCYFPAMEGLVKLHSLTGERKYLDTAITMAAFYRNFDRLPIDHAHGMLCNQVSLLLLYEATKERQYLERVEKRWDELVEGGYVNPAGGVLEKCRVRFERDEGCALADWLRLNLELARVTARTRYFDMAERTLHNHLLQNQTATGGFGHRRILCDQAGPIGLEGRIEEAYWCCNFHGQLAFINLRDHLTARADRVLTSNFALDFSCTDGAGEVSSKTLPAASTGEVLRQRFRLAGMPAMVLKVRHPCWADAVTAVDADGKALSLNRKDGFLATIRPVSEVVFIYSGGVYAEDRRGARLSHGPIRGESCVLGHGPKVLATLGRTSPVPAWPTTIAQLQAQGLVPLGPATRTKECCFVSAPFGSRSTMAKDQGEELYNGIRLPKVWPPRTMDQSSYEPMRVPYLENPPPVIPIDVGRQLFVDDFLISETSLKRGFHQARKYEGNPVLRPETTLEINHPGLSAACPKSGGVWWDPAQQLFRMWYEAGWTKVICHAVSRDGLHWERPELDVHPGSNRILDDSIVPDSWSVFPDYEGKDPAARWKMFLRRPGGSMNAGCAMVSPDGIHWSKAVPTGKCGDRSTMFYNPFRNKWVFSLRTSEGTGRARRYHESTDFLAGVKWNEFKSNVRPADNTPVYWAHADRLDLPDPEIGEKAQLYNLDAVAYESILLGLYEIHLGPDNALCKLTGLPKITELNLAYSRDGFHWHRPDRAPFIPAARQDVWDRGYVQSVGGLCVIVGDQLWFYYSAFQGNTNKALKDPKGDGMTSGMYDRGATGVAFLRRDGFVSMDAAEKPGVLTTRPVTFTGRQLFVNLDAPQGELRVEILDETGKAIAPFTKENCEPVRADMTKQPMHWKNAGDLAGIAGRPVRFRFHLTNGKLYAFWVSADAEGASNGYLAAGGPNFRNRKDTPAREGQ